MKIQKIDIEQEKEILTNMIVYDTFLKYISPIYKVDLFKNNYSKILAAWCLSYYQKYEKAPRHYIQEIYTAEKANLHNEIAELIEIYLLSLAKKFEEEYTEKSFNIDYEIDKTQKYFRKVEIENLKNNLENCLLQNKIDEAESFIANFRRMTKAKTAGLDVFSNEAVSKLLDNEKNNLIRFTGALGDLIGSMNRGDLISLAGPKGRGKTWWLQEFALLAIKEKVKVLFVSLEMPEEQMLFRIYQRLLGAGRAEKQIDIPKFDENNCLYQDEILSRCLYDMDLYKKAKSFEDMFGKNLWRLICLPIRSIKASDLIPILDNLEYYDKFIPDIIITDYADIFAPESNKDGRNQINDTWTYLRNIAHDRHNLVITATHSNKSTFKKNIGQADITEDIRKLNHVALMFALDQIKGDKSKGIMRIRILANRHEEFDVNKEVIVLQQLSIGRPILDSRKIEDTNIKKGGEDDE